jgi:TonB family protein
MPKLTRAVLTLWLSASTLSAQTQRAGWEIDTSHSAVALLLRSIITDQESSSATPTPPMLIVRCRESRLELYLATWSTLDGDQGITPVGIRWGGGTAAPEDAKWERSKDHTAVFAPEPHQFLMQLVANPDLSVEVHPAGAPPRVITFDARGLDRHMLRLDAACPPRTENIAAAPDTVMIDLGGGNIQRVSRNQVFLETRIDQHPEFVSSPPLLYPDAMRRAHIEGRVVIRAIIDTTGRIEPRSVKILETPNPGFDQSVRFFVLHAFYRPARVHGRAVRVLVNIPIDFKIPPGEVRSMLVPRPSSRPE